MKIPALDAPIKVEGNKQQGLIFAIISCGSAAINWFTYGFILTITQVDVMHIVLSNIIACLMGLIFTLFANKTYMIKDEDWNIKTVLRQGRKLFISRGITTVIETISLAIIFSFEITLSLFGIKTMLAKIIISIVMAILNILVVEFLSNKTNKKVS